jgi:tagatose 1,6-diphosphate aldolase
MIKLTPGKLAGLKAVSDHRGVIAAAAMDQRGSLQKSLAKERGAAADAHDLEEFKILVTSVLTKHASAILLDPEFGLPASKHRNGKGLLLAYEKTGYDAATPGRLPDLLDVWSVQRLKAAGADCVKILLYYTPYEKTAVNDLKHAWIERIGSECVAHDIPFFLEFVGYDADGGDEKSVAYAKKKPEIVSGSMAEFGKAHYNVDVLKVEVPVEMAFVEGTKSFKGEKAYTRAEALQHFRDAATMTHKPFIYLSAGVSNPVFIETLELAVESGTTFNGVLCGRATWKDGIAIYAKQGSKAFEDWLNTTGVENITNVNNALK